MPDTTRSLASLQTLLADNTAGDISAQDVRDFLVSAYKPQALTPGGRLTTETGVGVSTSDRTSQGTIYYTPFTHNGIGLYDGTSWTLHTFTERSLALSGLTSDKNYDVFLYDNAGTLTLELSAAWTNDTTRADALTTQDGVYVKSGATTRRYLGTIRTTGTAATEDSKAKRFVWNAYNRVARSLAKTNTASWSYGSATYRAANNDTANRVQVVSGLAGASSVDLTLATSRFAGFTGHMFHAFGEDSTTTVANDVNVENTTLSGAQYGYGSSRLNRQVPLGFHYYQWIESSPSGTQTINDLVVVQGITGAFDA